MKASAVIFDMDGVLVDSEPLHHRALNRALAPWGHALTFAEHAAFAGTTVQFTWSELARRLGLPGELSAHVAAYDRHVLEVLAEPLTPNPGVLALLDALDRRGLPAAVASSSRRPWVEATLAGLGLAGRFRATISGDDVARGKPDPAIYRAAAAALGRAPAECLAIEDAPAGIAAARAAGMLVVALRTPYVPPERLAGAARVIDSLAAFPFDLLTVDGRR